MNRLKNTSLQVSLQYVRALAENRLAKHAISNHVEALLLCNNVATESAQIFTHFGPEVVGRHERRLRFG